MGFVLVVTGEDTEACSDPAEDGVDPWSVTTNVRDDDNKLP